MVGPGTLEVGFSVSNHPEVIKATKDVQTAYEALIGSVVRARGQLDTAAVGWDGMEAKLTKYSTTVKTVGTEVETNLIGKFKNGILQLNNIDLGRTNTALDVSRQKFNALGQTVVQNATSFGILSASTFGIINSISNLERQSVLLEQRQLRLQTSTTTLHQAELALATAKNSTSTSNERLTILEERVTNARTKLQVETGKLAVAQQDYNENLGAFYSQIMPQVVNVAGAGVQTFTGLRKAISENHISLTDFKNVISSIFGGRGGGDITGGFNRIASSVSIFSKQTTEATGSATSLANGISPLNQMLPAVSTNMEKTTQKTVGLKGAFSGLGGAILIGGLVALGGFLVSLGVDAYNTQKKVAELRAEMVLLTKGTEAYYRNLAAQAAAFNKSEVGQIGEFLANNQVTIWGTKPLIGFNFREVAKNQTSELVNGIRADLIKSWNDTMSSPEMKLIGLLPPSTQTSIKSNMDKIMAFIVTDVNWQDIAHAETTTKIAEPIGKGVAEALAQIPQLIASGAVKVDMTKLMLSQFADPKIADAANKTIGAFANVVKSGAVPMELLTDDIKSFVQVLVDGKAITQDQAETVIYLANAHLNNLSPAVKGTTALEKARLKVIDDTIARDRKLAEAAVEQQIAREAEVASIKATAGALLGVDAIQGKSIGQLEAFNDTLGKQILALGEKVIATRKAADAEQMATDTTLEMVDAQFDYLESMVNTNKINDGSIDTWIKMRQATLNGMTATQDFITQTKLQKIEQDATNSTLLDYVTNVDKIKVPPGLQLTTEQLKALHTEFINTGNAALALEKIVNERIRPSFEHFGDIFSATTWKEFKNAWKDMTKSGAMQGVPKKLRESIRDIGSDLIDVNKHAKEATNVIDALMVNAYSGRQKGQKAGIRALLDDMKEIPGSEKLGPFKTMLKDILDLPKDERTKALMKYTDAFNAYKEAIKPDSPGGTSVTAGEAAKINFFTLAVQNGLNPLTNYTTAMTNFSTAVVATGDALKQIKEAEKNFDPTKYVVSGYTSQGTPIYKRQDLVSTTTKEETFSSAVDKFQAAVDKFASGGGNNMWDMAAGGVGTAPKSAPAPKTVPAPTIAPPAPVVFPMPDLSNITKGVALAEQDLGSVYTFLQNLKLAFTKPDTVLISTGVTESMSILKNTETYLTSTLKLAFQKPDTVNISTGVTESMSILKMSQVYITGLKLTFQKPDTANVSSGVTESMSILKNTQTYITSTLKLPFQKPDTVQVSKGTAEAISILGNVKKYIEGLKLKFPKPDTSQVDSAVSHIKSQLNSIPTEIVTHHKVVEDKAFGGLVSMQGGGMFTSSHQQTFQISDNPSHQETVAFIPHEPGLAEPILKQIQSMFPAFFASRQGGNRVVRENKITNTVENRTTPTNLYATFVIDLGKELGKVRKYARINIGEFNIG